MNTSTIEIPISNYDVNENLPDLLENKQSFTEHCIIKIGFPVKEHLIKIKFIADPDGKKYIREVKKWLII